jgi:hypothetical protein
LPPEIAHVWNWFRELSAARGEGFSGPGNIGYRDISAWSQLTGSFPSPAEVRLLISMDNAWRAEIRRLLELKTPPGK